MSTHLADVNSLLAGGDIKGHLQKNRQTAEKIKDYAVEGLKASAFQYHTMIVNAAQELKGTRLLLQH